jgi:hypothetical protein
LDHQETKNVIELAANWGKQPLEVKATITSKGTNRQGEPEDTQLVSTGLKENPDVLSATNASHVQALAALEVVAAALNDTSFADAKARLLFPPPPPPTDEVIVRGTLDWVLFHRRRTKQCSESAIVSAPQAPSRRYDVFSLRGDGLDDAGSLRSSLQSGQIDPNRLARVDIVEFGGGVATLLTQTDDLLKDWQLAKPGNLITFGAIANRDSAAADGEVLARTRLDRLEDALAPASKLHPDAQSELLTKIPNGTPASAVDGAIFLITVTQIATTCHSVFRVAAEQFPAVLRTVQAGDLATALGQFGAQAVAEVNFKSGSNDPADNSLQDAGQKWKALGGGQPGQIATVISTTNQAVTQALAVTQATAIGKALSDPTAPAGPSVVGVVSPGVFPTSIKCAVITFVAPQPPPAVIRTGLVIFGSLDGPTHFPAREGQRATVQFSNNVPQGDVLTTLIKSLTPNQPVNGVLLASLSGALDPGAASRAGAVANAVLKVQSRPAGSVKSRTGKLSDSDKQQLAGIGVTLTGIDEVIYLESNPPQ